VLDFLIKNANVYDGSGAGPQSVDVAVRDGVIVAVQADITAPTREVVDAGGLSLMPGIVDGHTHLDAQLTWDPFGSPSPSLGVTTVVIGNCGFTIAPCRPDDRDMTLRNLTHVEGMSLAALREGVKWEFSSFQEYLDFLSARGVGLNVAAFVGHSSVRTYVMGDDASRRVATDSELEAMVKLVRLAMDNGAVGFSSTTADGHFGEGGCPMPSRLADQREFEALTGVLGDMGKGVFMITRGESTSIDSLESLAAKSGRTTLISGGLLHNPGNPRKNLDLLEQISLARKRGNRLIAEISCCPLTMDFTMKGAYIFEPFPAWGPATRAHGADLKSIYSNPDFRAAVKADLRKLKGTRMFSNEWDKLTVVETSLPKNIQLEGRTIASIASERGVDPLDCLLDIALEEDLETQFTAILLNSDVDAVSKIITDRDNYITLSDAGAHTTFFCDAGFGLHLLGFWVREQKAMSLESAIERLTAQPAKLFGLKRRGLIKPGFAADLLMFDPATVGRGRNKRVHDFPGGAARLVSPGIGVHGVWVNGVRVVQDDGSPTESHKPGTILRDFDHELPVGRSTELAL